MRIPKLGEAVESLKCIKCAKSAKDLPDNIMDCATVGCPFKKVVNDVISEKAKDDG